MHPVLGYSRHVTAFFLKVSPPSRTLAQNYLNPTSIPALVFVFFFFFFFLPGTISELKGIVAQAQSQ